VSDGWTEEAWNTCMLKRCRGPVERADGSVEFFDGCEAICTSCGAEYTVGISGDHIWLHRERKSATSRKRA
jgi:hypothetical protein